MFKKKEHAPLNDIHTQVLLDRARHYVPFEVGTYVLVQRNGCNPIIYGKIIEVIEAKEEKVFKCLYVIETYISKEITFALSSDIISPESIWRK